MTGVQVNRVKGELTFSNRVLEVIKRNEIKNKLILYAVVIFLVVSILFIVYFKFLK